jgi:ribose 5-phosphate isomerase B
MKKIFIGADHAGTLFKKKLKVYLETKGYLVVDCGSHEEEKSVDYPDFAHLVCKNVLTEKAIGILICGSGIGMSITANRYPGIRAALCWNQKVARLSREQDDANVLVLGARLISYLSAKGCVDIFLDSSFEGGRHQRRIEKIENVVK